MGAVILIGDLLLFWTRSASMRDAEDYYFSNRAEQKGALAAFLVHNSVYHRVEQLLFSPSTSDMLTDATLMKSFRRKTRSYI